MYKRQLKHRGVQDILIACVDGLTGFPQAIQAAFPHTQVQLCVVHQIRNSLKYVASKNQKEFMGDLKLVYQAPSRDIAEQHLLQLEEKWGSKYPMVIKYWQDNWEPLSHYSVSYTHLDVYKRQNPYCSNSLRMV